MNINNLIIIVLILGFVVLLFFPEPEDNFLAYMGTALFFTILIALLVCWPRNKK